MDPLDGLSAVLIILAAINWVAAAILAHGAWRHRWVALVERAVVACLLAIAGTLVAIVAAARLLEVTLSSTVSQVLLVVPLVLIYVPGMVWVIAYASGRFDESAE